MEQKNNPKNKNNNSNRKSGSSYQNTSGGPNNGPRPNSGQQNTQNNHANPSNSRNSGPNNNSRNQNQNRPGPPGMNSQNRTGPPGMNNQSRPGPPGMNNQNRSSPSEMNNQNRNNNQNQGMNQAQNRPPNNNNFNNNRPPQQRNYSQNQSNSSAGVLKGQVELRNKIVTKAQMPDRPGYCTIGISVDVEANCWDMKYNSVDAIMYDFEIKTAKFVNMKDIKVRESDLKQLHKLIPKHFDNKLIYDGGKIVYSINEIPGVGDKKVVKKCIIPDPLERDDIEVTFDIQKVQTVSTNQLSEYVSKKLKITQYPSESIRFLDCVLRGILSENADHLMRNCYFKSKCTKEKADKLMNIHNGIVSSIRPQWKVRININMKTKGFFPAGNLADILYEKYQDSIQDPRRAREIFDDLRHLKAVCFHNKGADGKPYKKKVTIHGLSRNSCDKEMIPDLKKSISQYFEQNYSIKLKYPELPAIKINPNKDSYIPMELLEILPFQAPNAKQCDVAGEIVRCSAVKPVERFKMLDDCIKDLIKRKNYLTKTYGVEIKPQKVRITGKVLPYPENFGQGQWRNDSFKEPAFRSQSIPWVILRVLGNSGSPNMGVKDAEDVEINLINNAKRMGLNFAKPKTFSARRAELEKYFNDFKTNGTKLIVVLLYDKTSYGYVKFLGDLQIGIVTQCLLPATIRKNPYANLLLKINSKLGGLNWEVGYCKPPKELIQVFGMDVTHPTGIQKDGIKKSIAAVSASISRNLMRYSVIISEQITSDPTNKAVKEIIEQLDEIISRLIKMNFDENKELPTRLIFYRDGVSEGQFKQVLVNELEMIQKACKKIRPDYEPGITFITVQKRHQVRFIKSGNNQNLDPGTVIDTEVVHPKEFDFYLCSHRGIQGTSSPSHYYILYDDNDWDANTLQLFTYSLCYAYVRCCMSVSIPAPTYYSHHAAFRAREWQSNQGNRFLKNGLFQIHQAQERSMFFV